MRLSGGADDSMGAVMLYNNNQWNLVCSEAIDKVAAQVICRQLNYQDGRAIPKSAFGDIEIENTPVPLKYNSISCSGSETSVFDCRVTYTGGRCPSNTYASVYCSDGVIDENGKFLIIQEIVFT